MQKEVSFGGIFRALASLLSGSSREVALFTLVVGGLTAAGIVSGMTEPTSGTVDFGFMVDDTSSPASALFDLVSAVVGVVANYLLIKRFVAVTGQNDSGNRFWPYVGMAILSAIGIVLGMILLIVPGIILLVRWSAASGYLIGEGQGVTESLSSSWSATKGHSWPIFFAGLVLFLGVAIAAGMIGGILGVISTTAVNAVSAFLEAVSSAIFSAFGIAIYSLVRNDSRQLNEVFA